MESKFSELIQYPKQVQHLGIVIHMQSYKYSDDPNINRSINMDISFQEVFDALSRHFSASKAKINYAIIGHEHGEGLGKAHYQCYIQFSDRVTKTKKGFEELEINDLKYPLLFEKVLNISGIIKYCKKENNFFEYGKLRPDARSLVLEDLSNKNNRSAILRTPGGIRQYQKNTELLLAYQEEETEFRYQFPSWLQQTYSETEHEKNCYKLIYEWYSSYCHEEKERRKALVLYSSQRGIGKTCLAKSFVGDDPKRMILCRNDFNKEQFLFSDSAKILILDDMYYDVKQIELWKALLVSEPCSIRAAYCNEQFDGSLPCVVTTNNASFFNLMINDPMFRSSCIFVHCLKYLGPPGTKEVDIELKAAIHWDLFANEVEAVKNKKKSIKNYFAPKPLPSKAQNSEVPVEQAEKAGRWKMRVDYVTGKTEMTWVEVDPVSGKTLEFDDNLVKSKPLEKDSEVLRLETDSRFDILPVGKEPEKASIFDDSQYIDNTSFQIDNYFHNL